MLTQKIQFFTLAVSGNASPCNSDQAESSVPDRQTDGQGWVFKILTFLLYYLYTNSHTKSQKHKLYWAKLRNMKN